MNYERFMQKVGGAVNTALLAKGKSFDDIKEIHVSGTIIYFEVDENNTFRLALEELPEPTEQK